jgi:predicted NodU family carbamoyl transferase
VVLRLRLEETQKLRPMPAPMPTAKKKPNRNLNNKSHVKHLNLVDAKAVVAAAADRTVTQNQSLEVMPLRTVDAVNANVRRSKEAVVVVAPWTTSLRTFLAVMRLAELARWFRTPQETPSTKSETQLAKHSVVLLEEAVKSKVVVKKRKTGARASSFV